MLYRAALTLGLIFFSLLSWDMKRCIFFFSSCVSKGGDHPQGLVTSHADLNRSVWIVYQIYLPGCLIFTIYHSFLTMPLFPAVDFFLFFSTTDHFSDEPKPPGCPTAVPSRYSLFLRCPTPLSPICTSPLPGMLLSCALRFHSHPVPLGKILFTLVYRGQVVAPGWKYWSSCGYALLTVRTTPIHS